MIERNWRSLIRPEKLGVEIGADAQRSATIVAEPLERGFGMTLGNALRRVLLSSLQGAAVTGLRIDGVLHEFSSIQGVREDVTDLVLNVKQLAIRMQGEGPKRLALTAEGPGEVTAGQIQTTGDIEIANPDLVHLHARRRRQAVDGADGRHRQGLRPGVAEPAGGCADRADPGGCDLLARCAASPIAWSRPAWAR